MATQRAMEAKLTGEFNLVAAAHLAGPYCVSVALVEGMGNPMQDVQTILPFEITSLQKVYGDLYARVEDVFQAPDGVKASLRGSFRRPPTGPGPSVEGGRWNQGKRGRSCRFHW